MEYLWYILAAGAYRAGNVVLGAFSLFLTFCIGIRFLVKPETEQKQPMTEKNGLDKKGIAISLSFGLTIGFGTSTFIMTFTALIASVSHMMIEPSILLERWDALLICVSVATFSSLVSVRFANRVNSRTVSLVIGAERSGFMTKMKKITLSVLGT